MVTILIKRKTASIKVESKKNKIDGVSPLLGISSILIGTTIMIGYIVVRYLGKLGMYLAEHLKIWIG
jgi:uncharacterized membrane protein YkgB